MQTSERETLADELYSALEILSRAHDSATKQGLKDSRSGLYKAITDAYTSTQEAIQRLDDAVDY